MRNHQRKHGAHNDVETQKDASLHGSEPEPAGAPDQPLVWRLQSTGAQENEEAQSQSTPLTVRPGQLKAPRVEMHRRSSRRLSLLIAVALGLLLLGVALGVWRQAQTQTTRLADHQQKTDNGQQSQPAQLYSVFTDFGHRSIYRLDPASGQPLWHFTMKTGFEPHGGLGFTGPGGPQVVNGILYFQGATHDGLSVYAVNATTGALVWKSLAGEAGTAFVVANGLVSIAQNSSDNEFILALNAATGQQVWQQRSQGFGYHIQIVGATSGVLYALSYQRTKASSLLYALNAHTGSPLWQTVVSQPEEIIFWKRVGSTLYLPGRANLSAYDLVTGTQRWSTAITGSVNTFDVEHQTLYATTFEKGQQGSAIYVLRASDGLIRWQQHPGSEIISMVDAGGEMYVVSYEMNAGSLQLEALRGTDGHLDWQQAMPADVGDLIMPVVIGSDLYLGGRSDTIDVIDRSNGKLRKTLTFPGAVTGYSPGVILFVA